EQARTTRRTATTVRMVHDPGGRVVGKAASGGPGRDGRPRPPPIPRRRGAVQGRAGEMGARGRAGRPAPRPTWQAGAPTVYAPLPLLAQDREWAVSEPSCGRGDGVYQASGDAGGRDTRGSRRGAP